MRRRALSYSLLALAAVGATGGFVAHRILDRPGATALTLVPADALAVASFDLVPAPDQVLAFKHIDETISAATKGKANLDNAFVSMFDSEPRLKPLAAQLGRSFAFAWLPTPGKPKVEDGSALVFVALKDASAFSQSLAKIGKPVALAGGKAYNIGDHGESILVTVVGDYAVGSDKAWPLAAVGRVARGDAPAVTSAPAFVAARAQALPSSNLLVMASPQLAKLAGAGEWKSDEWAVSSMAIRELGMEFAVSAQSNDPRLLKAGELKPLGRTFLDAMPRGAYGFLAMSQPGPAVGIAGKSLDEPSKEIKEQTDLDLRADILPALGGNVGVAYYPSFGADAGIDMLVSVDDANGADPASLARRLEGYLDKEAAKDKSMKGPWKVGLPMEGADAYRLADEPTTEMQKSAKEAERSFFRPLTLSRGKTVAWATVGNSVLLATSQDLLARAVFARRNPSPAVGLSGDTALGADPTRAADGQFALALSMRRLAEGMRNTIDPSHMSVETAGWYRKTLGLFDATTEPLAMRAAVTPGGRYYGYTSIPLDWSKLPGFFEK